MDYTQYHNEIMDYNTILALKEYAKMISIQEKEDMLTWLGKNMYLPVSMGRTGYYSISEYPYLKEFFENLKEDSGVTEQAWYKSAQSGLTTAMMAAQFYFCINDPCPQGIYMPSEVSMNAYRVGKFDAVLAVSPNISKMFGNRRSRDTIFSKKLASLHNGSTFEFHAMGSPNSTASSTISRAWADEVSRYDNFTEGNPLNLIRGRIRAIENAKLTIISTPTKTGSPIDIEFNKGDKRQYLCPCPKCGEKQTFEFERLIFDRKIRQAYEVDDVRMECIKCNYPINDKERIQMRYFGEWTPTQKSVENVRSYYSSEFITPQENLFTIIARKYINCFDKEAFGDEYKLNYKSYQDFHNICLARNYDNDEIILTDSTDYSRYRTIQVHNIKVGGEIKQKAIAFKRGIVPADVHTICIGIDTQNGSSTFKDYSNYFDKPRFELHYIGFSETNAYSIDYDVIHGGNNGVIDFTLLYSFKEELEEKILRSFKTLAPTAKNNFKTEIRPSMVFMDAFGSKIQTRGCIEFYLNKFSPKSSLQDTRIHLIKGGEARVKDYSFFKQMRTFADLSTAIDNHFGSTKRKQIEAQEHRDVLKSYIVHANRVKEEARYMVDRRDLTFASDYPDFYYEQLFSEKMLLNEKTKEIYFEKKHSKIRNEFLDTTVYALAAYELQKMTEQHKRLLIDIHENIRNQNK